MFLYKHCKLPTPLRGLSFRLDGACDGWWHLGFGHHHAPGDYCRGGWNGAGVGDRRLVAVAIDNFGFGAFPGQLLDVLAGKESDTQLVSPIEGLPPHESQETTTRLDGLFGGQVDEGVTQLGLDPTRQLATLVRSRVPLQGSKK